MTTLQARLWLVFCVVLWSTSGLMIKLSSLDALALNAGRNLLTALIVWIYLRRPHFTFSLPQVGGALASVIAQYLFVRGTQLTSAANAILLQYSAPFFVAIFAIWYLNERPKAIDWVTMALTPLGMVLFFAEKLDRNGILGNTYAILSGIALAWMILFLRKQKDGSPLETILMGSLIISVTGLPSLLRSSPTPADWAIISYMGIFQLGIPFLIYGILIKYLEAVEATLIQTLEPILNPLWVLFFYGEVPSQLAILGGAIVVSAVTFRVIWSSRQQAQTPIHTASS
ncbi:MAG: DMT family transporter [Caldilineaceae bacterium]